MKKIFFAIVMALCAMGVQAQHASDVSVWSENDNAAHSGVFTNVILGAYTGDIETGAGLGLDLGYRYHIISGLHWNILTVGTNFAWNNDEYDGGDFLNVRFKSGAHYITPEILGSKRMYVDFNLGYSVNTKYSELNGFTYDVGLGVNLSRLFSLGITWDAISKDSATWGIIGAKFGFNF